MKPVVFEQCAGFLHGDRARRAVVLLSAHGFEELCSRRFMRRLGEACAEAGLPALRFDYEGTGDSAGNDEDPDRLATWVRNVHAAVDRVKTETGAVEVALVGLRLGAMLAAQAAAERSDVTTLALLAAPASGKSYVREQMALGRVIAGALPPPPPGADASVDGIDVAGFLTTRATLDALRAVTWDGFAAPSVRHVLVLRMRATETAGGPAEAFARGGAAVATRPFAGYDRLMCDPTASEIPLGVVEEVARWLGSASPKERSVQRGAPEQPSIAARLRTEAWVEERVAFGRNGMLAGVYCRPRESRISATKTFVFLNAGAIPHTGWARMSVEQARRLASLGFASLRMDFAGIGDSAEPGAPRQFLYSADSKADIIAALNWLETRAHRDFALVGACSGAFQAFHAAVADARIRALVLVNQLCFVWGPSYALTLTGWKVSRSVDVAVRRRAETDEERDTPSPLLRTARGLLAAAKTSARGTLRFLRRAWHVIGTGTSTLKPSRNPVARWFETLSKRGTQILLVHGESDASRDELARYMGPGGQDALALPGVQLELLAGTDHTLTPRHARQALSDRLVAFAQSPAASVPGREPALAPGIVPEAALGSAKALPRLGPLHPSSNQVAAS